MRNILRIITRITNKIQFNLGIKRAITQLLKFIINTKGPWMVRINPVNFNCNHDCIMCWRRLLTNKERKKHIKKDLRSLDLKDYKKLFSQLPLSVHTINVTGGGEPLIHNQILEILKLIKRYNYHGYLITNGVLLNKKIKTLYRMDWDFIRISFHAADRYSYKRVHNRDDFEKVISNIRLINKYRKRFFKDIMRISLLYVIQKFNYSKINKFVGLAENLKVDEIEFDNLIPLNKEVLLSLNQIKKVTKDLKKVANSCQIANNANEVIMRYREFYNNNSLSREFSNILRTRFLGKKCDVVENSVFITSQGIIQPCCLLSTTTGNIKKNRFMRIWNSKRYKDLRFNLNQGKFYPDCYKYCSYNLQDI